MKCPSCAGRDFKTQDTRQEDDIVRRRRVCLGCGERIVTIERVDGVYVPGEAGRPMSATTRVKKVAEAKPARGKKLLVKRAEARRKIEDLMDEREDYSMYDDLAEVGHLWK